MQTHLPRPNTLDDNREPAGKLLDPSDVGPLERRVVTPVESVIGLEATLRAIETCTHSERRECLSDRVMGLPAGAWDGQHPSWETCGSPHGVSFDRSRADADVLHELDIISVKRCCRS